MDRSFVIDDEIQSLLPPLSEDELHKLHDQIALEGHVDPLIILSIGDQKLLGDGHHRLGICEELQINYKTRQLKMPSRELAIQWVVDNQLGRRNLTDERRAYYIGKKYLAAKQDHGGDRKSSGKSCNLIGPALEKVAKETKVSPRTVSNNAAFAEAVDAIGKTDPEAKSAILDGSLGATKSEVVNAAANGHAVLCRNCRVRGINPNCKHCKELRRPREPGVEPKQQRSPKPGKPLFDDRSITDLIRKFVKAIDERAKFYGKTAAFKDMESRLEAVAASWKRWQLEKELK